MSSHSSSSSSPPPQFHNAASHAAADPFVLYDARSARYYAYSTEGADEGFNFGIYSSPDLATWHRHPGGALRACRDGDAKPLADGQACWARDWLWAPETYYNEKTGWYFFVFAGRLREDLAKDHFRYSAFEEPSKLGVAVSRSPAGPFREIEPRPIDWYPFDPDYHDVNLIMDDKQMLPPRDLSDGQKAPRGTYIPTIDPNILFDDDDGRVYLYASRNAYRNWNWDAELGKYVEESNIIVVELARDWWDDPTASTMPAIVASQIDAHAKDAPPLPDDIGSSSYNGTGEIGNPPRKDGWKTVISYGADPQAWENFHVNDYDKYNGTKKDRRWAEGSTVIRRPDAHTGKPVYLLTYSANNFEASNYGVGFATAESPLGPFRKSAKNPVLSQEPDGAIPIYSTGHGSIVASPSSSPPSSHGHEEGGGDPQEVTLRTPEGAELFYVHHARNSTTQGRSLYTTRMTLDESAVRFGSDDAIAMSLTPLDQPLPRDTYPIQMEASCGSSSQQHVDGDEGNKKSRRYNVRVVSKHGASFDLREASNRVVAACGSNREATSIVDGQREGEFVLTFGEGAARSGLVYQRRNVDGSWSTVARASVRCRD
ncbi:hypothetical protein JDV02_002152 [Purpureocillium takamizusanense]|uniref:Uncharacterized protein n=1 Tax=Purpureocillium takamizusanense TaxID=2060973 RepID=A0A9Q8Q863_9HYPO|nr:uncharacterized protein JDV02_002152 [Purpureocillium takamizusanense]UNI15639.1 hypothetical protein JDV02_002152 [Purpureocillium takamizusanense]